MSNQVIDSTEMLHPILIDCVQRIKENVINKHSMPFRLFETGRSPERHKMLFEKGKTQIFYTRHSFDLLGNLPLYSWAIDYVLYNGRWSWNLRDKTIESWYKLFGNVVLDVCPELEWGGNIRKSVNYNHFQLRDSIVIENLEIIPCNLHIGAYNG